MTFPFQSARNEDRICPFLKGREQMEDIHLSRAEELDNPHVGRILQPHGTGQIGSRVCTELTGEGNNLRFVINHTFLSRVVQAMSALSNASNNASHLAMT